MSVYKKFTSQDQALIPFNAHKQYNFTSASSTTNSVTWFNTQWTSESISLYSSASATYGSDTKNVVKYNQIDHLFYRNFLKTVGDKLGPIHYLKQARHLYNKSNILSIPTGLYGHEIKPGSFYLSSSTKEIIDDTYGNLYISGTNLDNYPDDVRQNVFKLEPIKGFKRYDLGVYSDYVSYKIVSGKNQLNKHLEINGSFWRRGETNPNAPLTYTTLIPKDSNGEPILELSPNDEDDSYFFNRLYYSNITLSSSISESSQISFNGTTGSYISSSHNERFNFNKDEDFSISFYIQPKAFGVGEAAIGHTFQINEFTGTDKRHIINKSGIKTGPLSEEKQAEPQFPFEIYIQSSSIYFDRSDGDTLYSVSQSLSTGSLTGSHHVLCQVDGTRMQIWHNGFLLKQEIFTINKQTQNNANLYIGTKKSLSLNDAFINSNTSGSLPSDRFFNGFISNINIWSKAYNSTQITNISESLNGSPYIGNLFYQNGFAVITHPMHQDILKNSGNSDSLNKLQFQGSHLIYEHEYQCTARENEYNSTYNLTARKTQSTKSRTPADFTTGSFWKPYVTTVGLYNEKNELLVVGKLGQPIRMSDETDTTFVLRWDS